MPVVFKSLGIQCEKRQDIERSLQVRSGLLRSSSHAQRSNRPLTFDLHAVRLCFRVYLEGSDKGKFTVPLKKVVSDIIYNKKSSMMIMKLSRCNAYCDGGHDVIILCEKVKLKTTFRGCSNYCRESSSYFLTSLTRRLQKMT